MEEKLKKVFEQYMNKDLFDKFKEELDKNPNFKISKDNIEKFFECENILQILKDYNIKYDAKLEEVWEGNHHYPKYYIKLSIFIKENDYEKIKKYFDVPNTFEEYDDTNFEIKIVENIKVIIYILIGLLITSIGIVLFLQNISNIISNIENVISSILITIFGLILLIYGIRKIYIRKIKK